jgi:ATP-dependent Clp protease ATP-binding subunit ClpA
MWARYTERARQVVVLAQEEARKLKHPYIGTEHLLLGLIGEEHGVGAKSLDALGITSDHVRQEILRIVGEGNAGESHISGQLPFTPRSKKVLELGLREALSLGHNYIGTEHVLLGLVRENEGVATQILDEAGATAGAIRSEVIRKLSGTPSRLVHATWSRSDVDLNQLWESPQGHVWRVVGICDDPTVILESLRADGARESYVISSPLFGKWKRLERKEAG